MIDASQHEFTDWVGLLQIVDTIPLQQTEESIIGTLDKVIINDKCILIADNKSGKIYKFAPDGTFLFSAGELGHANNEFIRISDMIMSDDQTKFAILDDRGMLWYELSTGKFLCRDSPFDKDDYWDKLASDKSGGFYVFSLTGDATIRHFPAHGKEKELRPYKCRQLLTNKFYEYDGYTCVLPDWGEYTIERIVGDSLEPRYTFNLGEDIIPKTDKPQDLQEFDLLDNQDNLFRSVLRVFETIDYLYATIVGPKNKYYSIIYNKHTHKVYAGPSDISTFHNLVAAGDNYFYVIVYPDYVNKNSPLSDYVDNLRDNDFSNPILLRVRVKENNNI